MWAPCVDRVSACLTGETNHLSSSRTPLPATPRARIGPIHLWQSLRRVVYPCPRRGRRRVHFQGPPEQAQAGARRPAGLDGPRPRLRPARRASSCRPKVSGQPLRRLTGAAASIRVFLRGASSYLHLVVAHPIPRGADGRRLRREELRAPKGRPLRGGDGAAGVPVRARHVRPGRRHAAVCQHRGQPRDAHGRQGQVRCALPFCDVLPLSPWRCGGGRTAASRC